MKRRKVTVIGAGNVGGTTAQRLVEKGFGDIVLLDINEGMAQGKALDLCEAAPLYEYDSRIMGTSHYEDTTGSDLVIITSGVPRKPGMSRDDLLKVNIDIVKNVTRQAAKNSPEAILLVVSNPLDAMTYVTYKVSGFPKQRVMGMAGALDSARFRAFIAMELGVSVKNIHAMVLGGHGDTMVPMLRYTTVSGIPVADLIPKDRLEAIVKRTREGGAEIVNLLKTGSAYYAPSAAVVEMAEAIIQDKKAILPCAALCEGEYGIDRFFVGVPVKVGHGGVEKIIEVKLDSVEELELKKSVSAVKELCHKVDTML
ncbi:MAG: malate dehydrogenase [Nitrospira sp.]|nr:malate dehydrogenase [Nitrospira sp.]